MTATIAETRPAPAATDRLINAAHEQIFDAYQNPPAQFSPVPMWFWNDDLDTSEIQRQILSFHQREVDAFIIHPRMGLPRSIPYLSDTYLDYVVCAVETAAQYGMTVFLYDEAMYPSGSAHGQVVATNPAYAVQALARVVQPKGSSVAGLPGRLVHRMTAADPSGQAVDLLFVQTGSGGKIRGVHFGEDDNQSDAPPAADLMKPEAMACFIRLTHDRYYQRLAPWFGTTIQAFFTDEPSLLGRGNMKGKIPWTDGLLEQWIAEGRTAEDLNALFPESPAYNPDRARQFRRLCLQRLSKTYYEPLSRWCSDHGISLTGHPAQSDEIGLLRHFQIPGQDLVLRWVAPEDEKGITGRDSTLAKCCADAARHAGRMRNAVECLGCCVRNQPSQGWDLPPEDMKWYLDWLAVRGVNLFIPHAFYYSLRGQRAGERPPDVGPAQTWWSEYHDWARYMKRLSHLMTGCVTINPVAVLCTDDHLPWKIARILLENQLEFNYLEESYLSATACIQDGRLVVGPYAYRSILVEDPALFSDSTRKKLAECRRAGLDIVFWPDQADDAGGSWLANLLSASPVSVRSRTDPDAPLDSLRITCQQRGDDRFVLMTNEGKRDLDFFMMVRFTQQKPVLWDPWAGSWSSVAAQNREEGQEFCIQLQEHQSLVLLFSGVVKKLPGHFPEEFMSSGMNKQIEIRHLDGLWTISFPEKGLSVRRDSSELVSWQQILEDPAFSGQAVYTTLFHLKQHETGSVILDLGEVHDAATVYVNGSKTGTQFWHPYRYDITSAIQPGDNTLTVTVMNSISCRMDRVAKPSGLLGPVRLELTTGVLIMV
jgi:hypothetical protein